MKTPALKAAVALTLVAAMGISLPASALAQAANSPPGYWASDGNYYYYPTPAPQNQAPQYQGQQYPYQTPSRPSPFSTQAPSQADYLARARTQALSDYQRDQASWQAQRDANARAIADWDARYSRPTPPAPTPVSSNCDQRRDNNTVTGGILGALVGAAIGSNLAARNTRTEGAVLGGLAGAVIGANIGKTQTSCDAQGYYYTYDQTTPYQEPAAYRGRNSGQHDATYYNRQGCRLAEAPASANDYRYVRVCPDAQGRYRLTN